MDTTEQVTKWVEKKFEKIINKDLEEKITEENSVFDAETYANNLLDKLLISDDDLKNLKEILNPESCYDLIYTASENSTEDRSVHDSFESESNELQSFSLEDIVKNLESDSYEVRKKSLKVLESCVEDLMNQTSWNKIKEILQKMLNNTRDPEMVNLILKVFQKPLRCNKKPQIVSKGFTTTVEVLSHQIDLFNLKYTSTSFEDIYDIKEEEWLCEEKTGGFEIPAKKNEKTFSPEILIKLMWLLIDCQQQIPVKWVRFNEARFREIIFSFIHLLSSTNTSESMKLSGLELLSVLNPKASWCRYWCHTAVGRFLLCSALRKYKNFFISIIEIILNHMKITKKNKLPPVGNSNRFGKISPKSTDDVPDESKLLPKNINKTNNLQKNTKSYVEKTNLDDGTKYNGSDKSSERNFSKNTKLKKSKKLNSEWIIENIPRQIVAEAVFFHSVSFVSYLIQFRSGRALFPVQTTTRRRLLSAQDLSLSIIEYLESLDYTESSNSGVIYTSAYETEFLEILETLKKVKTHINSSRMSAEKQQFSYF